MIVNPFQLRPISKPEDFIGREKTVKRLISAISSLNSIAIQAERRTGATSILRYLASHNSRCLVDLADNHILVYFDFQSLSTQVSQEVVWNAILKAIQKDVQLKYPNLHSELEEMFNVELGKTVRDGVGGITIASILDELRELGITLHLLFDEFELTAYNPNLRDEFYNILRSLASAGKISYVVSTRDSLQSLTSAISGSVSPLFNMFMFIYLDAFDEEEVRALIQQYFGKTQLDASYALDLIGHLPLIYDITGYHPYFLQLFCYHLFDKINNQNWLSEKSKDEAIEDFTHDALPHFEFYWNMSSTLEKRIMYSLAMQQLVPDERIEMRKLEHRCLVIKDKNVLTEYKLFSSVFEKWSLRQSINSNIVVNSRRSQELQGYLLKNLNTRFSEQELRTLCFELHVEYSNLSGEGKSDKARELVGYLERRGRIPDLINLIKVQRPDISWDSETTI